MKPLHNLRQKFENSIPWIPAIGFIFLFFSEKRIQKQTMGWFYYQIAMFAFLIALKVFLIFAIVFRWII